LFLNGLFQLISAGCTTLVIPDGIFINVIFNVLATSITFRDASQHYYSNIRIPNKYRKVFEYIRIYSNNHRFYLMKYTKYSDYQHKD
jgi:hypothetical protein